MNGMRAVFLSCFILLVGLPAASGSGTDEFATSFCPECWKFLNSDKDVRFDGGCVVCGKISIAVEAFELSWTLCPGHDVWHRRPCAEVGLLKDRRVRTAIALVVSAGDERLQTAAYCPECGSFPAPMKMERGQCPTCKAPLAAVEIVEPAWFWCTHGGYWKEIPCAENGTRHCCEARRGTLHASIRRIAPVSP
jgi:hypothetical protein